MENIYKGNRKAKSRSLTVPQLSALLERKEKNLVLKGRKKFGLNLLKEEERVLTMLCRQLDSKENFKVERKYRN